MAATFSISGQNPPPGLLCQDIPRAWEESKPRPSISRGYICEKMSVKCVRSPIRTSLEVQWLRSLAPSAVSVGSIPGQGTRSQVQPLKIPHVTMKTWHGQISKKIFFKKNKAPLSVQRHRTFISPKPNLLSLELPIPMMLENLPLLTDDNLVNSRFFFSPF